MIAPIDPNVQDRVLRLRSGLTSFRRLIFRYASSTQAYTKDNEIEKNLEKISKHYALLKSGPFDGKQKIYFTSFRRKFNRLRDRVARFLNARNQALAEIDRVEKRVKSFKNLSTAGSTAWTANIIDDFRKIFQRYEDANIYWLYQLSIIALVVLIGILVRFRTVSQDYLDRLSEDEAMHRQKVIDAADEKVAGFLKVNNWAMDQSRHLEKTIEAWIESVERGQPPSMKLSLEMQKRIHNITTALASQARKVNVKPKMKSEASKGPEISIS